MPTHGGRGARALARRGRPAGALAARREPRLVVVEQGPPPTTEDWLEDWLRTPVDEEEVRIRLETSGAGVRIGATSS